MFVSSVHRTARLTLWLALGMLLGAALFVVLFFLDPGTAGAQEETTTTVETATTVAETTSTVPVNTTAAPPAAPEPVHSDPLGDPGATALLARLFAFALGVVVTR